MSNEEQRIIVSSLAYIVFDSMSKKVKEKKESEVETVECNVDAVWYESTSTLDRYAGAVLYSMIEKRKKVVQKSPRTKFFEYDENEAQNHEVC